MTGRLHFAQRVKGLTSLGRCSPTLCRGSTRGHRSSGNGPSPRTKKRSNGAGGRCSRLQAREAWRSHSRKHAIEKSIPSALPYLRMMKREHPSSNYLTMLQSRRYALHLSLIRSPAYHRRSRLGDYLRPNLWRIHGERQVYLTSLLTKVLGVGPALTACATIPDLDHFSGRGAKDTIPLYRTADASQANITPDLLQTPRHGVQA